MYSEAVLPAARRLRPRSRGRLPADRTERRRLESSSRLDACPAEVPDQASTRADTPLEPLVKVDHDPTGQHFLETLRGAVSRHVEVRVLIDYVGARYSWRPIARWLRRAGIPSVQFLPPLIPWRFQYSNLRSHRKILVVDGRIGFTGGINIHAGNCLERQPRHPVQDLHFRVTGPVVSQLQSVFADDWAFCTGERLQGEPWFSAVEPEGPVLARGIPDGPDDDFETPRLTLLGAIACARSSIHVVTPHFLPDASLLAALNVAALRGVQVDIILPAEND